MRSPIRFIDIDGMLPGDRLYKSADAAAMGWANKYAESSVKHNIEYSSMIYKVEIKNKTYYSFTSARTFNDKTHAEGHSPGPDGGGYSSKNKAW